MAVIVCAVMFLQESPNPFLVRAMLIASLPCWVPVRWLRPSKLEKPDKSLPAAYSMPVQNLAPSKKTAMLTTVCSHRYGVIILTVAGGYQSQNMGLRPFNPPLRG